VFCIDEFQKLKSHLMDGYLSSSFFLKPGIRISISDNTSLGRGWELRIHEEPTQRMCILTERDGQLAADYRHLVPLPDSGHALRAGHDFQPLSDRDFEQCAQALFAEAVVFLEHKRADETEAARQATERLRAIAGDEAARQRWRELARLLVHDPARGEKIAKATARAFAAPETFLRRLGLVQVTNALPWLALIAALRKDKLLVAFDWREAPGDIAAGVDKLCAQSGCPALDWAAVSGEGGGSAAELLNAATRALEAEGLTLVHLNDETDSFPTALLSLTSFDAVSARAAAFGWSINRHFA
jgi:hypothetical protein